MQDLNDKIAFVTGAGSGIGLAVAKALVAEGARVMLADIDEDRLCRAKAEIGQASETIVCDVARSDDLQKAADHTIETFGKVHIVMNNAGVGLGGRPGEVTLQDWRWVVDINLMGVVYGVETFTPLLRAHGEGGHIINTASMAGHFANEALGPYCATKFAVVGYSECLRQALAAENIGVSVLCPGWVKTDIANSGRHRPSGPPGDGDHNSRSGAGAGAGAGAGDAAETQPVAELIANGMPPEILAEWVIECIRANRQYIFTHAMMAPAIALRHQALKADYDAAVANQKLTGAQSTRSS